MRKLSFIISLFLIAITAKAASNEVTLKGTPTIQVTLDSEYTVLSVGPKAGTPKTDLSVYMLFPEDQQSSVVFTTGKGMNKETEKTIAEMYEGAKVTKIKGEIAGQQVEWWHYKDSNHLYSTCYATLVDKQGKKGEICIDLTANTPERLAALEKAFSELKIL